MVQSWQAGAISYETLYDNLRRGEITSPERTAEEEIDIISKEIDEFENILAAKLPPPAPANNSGSAAA